MAKGISKRDKKMCRIKIWRLKKGIKFFTMKGFILSTFANLVSFPNPF